MIYTLTANPCLDYKISLNSFVIVSGGKGINISKLLNKDSISSTILGFVGGEVGEEIVKGIDNNIIKDFVTIKNESRINYKIKIKEEIEINGEGPIISNYEKNKLINKIDNLNENDYLIISGSAPKSLGNDFYLEVVKRLKGTKFIIDCRKDLLLPTLAYKPELIKPNIIELEEIEGKKLNSIDDIRNAANKLLLLGAKRVIVSLGEKGSILVTKDTYIYKEAIVGNVLSTVGAGDAMVTGFLEGLIQNKTDEECYELAINKANDVVFKGVLL